MSDGHSLLLQVISSALLGKGIPTVAAEKMILLNNESKSQAVYPLVFSVLDC